MFLTLAGNEVPSGLGRCSWRALEATWSAWRIVPQRQQLCPATKEPWGVGLRFPTLSMQSRNTVMDALLSNDSTECCRTAPCRHGGKASLSSHCTCSANPCLLSTAFPNTPRTRFPMHVPITPVRSPQTFTIVNTLTCMII